MCARRIGYGRNGHAKLKLMRRSWPRAVKDSPTEMDWSRGSRASWPPLGVSSPPDRWLSNPCNVCGERYGHDVERENSASPEIRVALTRTLLHLLGASRRVVSACLEDGPQPGSQAAARAADQRAVGNWRDSDNAVGGVHTDICISGMSGLEHVRTLAGLLRSNLRLSTPLLTLTRGAVEALGRAEWMMSADDTTDLLTRHTRLAYREAKLAAEMDPNRTYRSDVKGTWTAADMRDTIAADARRMGLPSLKNVSYSEMATELVVKSVNGWEREGNPGAVYSDLSAAAHGEHFALGGLVAPTWDEGGAHSGSRIEADEKTVITTVGIAYLCTGRAVRTFIDYFGLARADQERWVGATLRADECWTVAAARVWPAQAT